MWNPTVGLGTVTHEYIGYLLPMGPFFAVFHLLGVPGLGRPAPVARLHPLRRRARHPLPLADPRPARPGPGRGRPGLHAVAVLPAVRRAHLGHPAALGRAALHAGRSPSSPCAGAAGANPALFALVVALVSGINASSIIYVGVGPDPVAPLRRGRAARGDLAPRAGHGAAHRRPDASGPASGGWRASRSRPAYGVNVLKFTETVPSTSATSNAADIVRGLGYWYFYGADHLGAVDQRGRPLHPGHRAAGDLVRRAGAGARGGRVRALARAGLLPRAALRRAGALGRALPLLRPDRRRRRAEGLHDRHDGRPGPALDRPGHPARAARRSPCCSPAA